MQSQIRDHLVEPAISGSCEHLQAECEEENNHKPPAAHEIGRQKAENVV